MNHETIEMVKWAVKTYVLVAVVIPIALLVVTVIVSYLISRKN